MFGTKKSNGDNGRQTNQDVSKEAVLDALTAVIDPDLHKNIVELGFDAR